MSERTIIEAARIEDRPAIYAMRHAAYAVELGQHPENDERRLSDGLDDANDYLVARENGRIVGFVSVTPPGGDYAVDKYVERTALPFAVDGGLFEVRLLTVAADRRRSSLAAVLMLAALRHVDSRGGRAIVALGRADLVDLYRRAGLEDTGAEVRAGKVRFRIMHADVPALRRRIGARDARRFFGRAARRLDWRLDVPMEPPEACVHGGESFEAIGVGFDDLSRRRGVIAADVLDAWFPPAPGIVETLTEALPWLLRTSPPARAEGLVRAVADARGVPEAALVVGAGSSALLFTALRELIPPGSRVLLPDPTYGEYAHLLGRLLGCRIETLPLLPARGYRLTAEALGPRLADGHDLVVLVNPNSPTGQHLGRRELEPLLDRIPPKTLVWIDETYVDFVGEGESLESIAAEHPSIVVCKSLSKAYALSGVRVGYLVTAPERARRLARFCPPWAVGLPGQIAATRALAAGDYYRERWRQTRRLRDELDDALGARGLAPLAGVANFLLARVDPAGRLDAFLAACRRRGLYLRDLRGLSETLAPGTFRIAVQDRITQRRMIEIIDEAREEARL